MTIPIPVGTPVIYYNRWTGFETTEFRDQFVPLSADDIRNLGKGDVIYVDIDPLHPNGKVYGRVKATVVGLNPVGDGECQIFYSAGRWNGMKSTKGGVCRDIDKAADEMALAAIIERLPLSKQLDVHDLI